MTGSNLTSGTFYDGSNRNYSYLYDKNLYTSLWIAYPLDKSTCSGSQKYSGNWKAAPESETGLKTTDQINIWSGSYGVDYGDSDIYARGHQIPDADRQYNETMVKQTYYAINCTPQIQYGFNGGIWNQLEQAVRKIVTDTGETIYVATGAAFQKGSTAEMISWIQPAHDSKSCPVPNYYWKAVLRIRFNADGSIAKADSIGFWFEHRIYSESNYANFAVSVNQLETWTGFDLFENLPDNLEETVESTSSWNTFRNQF